MHEDEIIDIYDFYNPSVDVFLNIEYKKRHFEYYDKQDSKWLNNHWNDITKYCFSDEQIFSVANSRLGWYRRATGWVSSFLLNADILAIRKGNRPGLVNPLEYYLR